jgi:hypothetical protein
VTTPNYNFPFPEPPWPEKGIMTNYITPTAVFDVLVDDEVQGTFEAPSRGEAHRMAGEAMPGISSLAFQNRVKLVVRDHDHWPAAGNTSVCVFCQVRIEQDGREYKERT